MYGNNVLFGIEVANEETQIFQVVTMIKHPNDIIDYRKEGDFNVVIFIEDNKRCFQRGEFVSLNQSDALLDKINKINGLMKK